MVGQFKNGGREWRPEGDPEQVNVHDFMDRQLGKAIPYGVCDIGANTGWVSVGTDHETAAFAVNALRSWWNAVGKSAYPDARHLLITADSGGANGNRRRAWKTELAALAAETGLEIGVCHLPPGTSKWNKCAWPGGRPGVMKCPRGPAGRGRRLDTGALRVRNKFGAGPAGPGIVAASTNPRFG